MICPACATENIDGTDRCENCLTSFRDLDIPGPEAAEGWARSVMEDKLSKVGYDEPIRVAPETPALDVVKQMKQRNSGCAVVLEDGKLVGIFTEHDVLLKMTSEKSKRESLVMDEEIVVLPVEQIPVNDMPFSEVPVEELRSENALFGEAAVSSVELEVATNEDGSELLVKDLMTKNPETLHEHETVAIALNKMSIGRYRHIPVERDDHTYTVTSIKDVLSYIAKEDW